MTYKNCLKLIDMAKKRGIDSAEWKEDMKEKLDVFLLANRLTDAEYKELIQKIDS